MRPQEAALWYGETMSALGLTVGGGRLEKRPRRPRRGGASEHRDDRARAIGGGDRPRRPSRQQQAGYGDNASGTAALVELARGFARQGDVPAPLLERTLIFLSTDAGAYGGAGAVRFAGHVAARRPCDRCDRPGRDRRARETASRHRRRQFEFTRAHAGQHGVGAGHRAGRAATGDLVVALAARRSRTPVRGR